MRHDELLESFDDRFGYGVLGKALRAVVERHTPKHSDTGYRCQIDFEPYPCSEIKVIEKELK